MENVVLIHGYSAESREVSREAIRAIYGDLPSYLEGKGAGIVEVNVSRYLSLEDGIGIEDASFALERVLRQEHPDLLEKGFNVIIHSTGALVIRNWLRRYSERPSPLKRIVYLAGANFGSGWAHIGESEISRWKNQIFYGGSERGLAMLRWLELGANETLDLHLHFLEKGNDPRKDFGTLEFCLVGSQVPALFTLIPIRYGKEDGADGVVRVASSNLNFHYMKIDPRRDLSMRKWDEIHTDSDLGISESDSNSDYGITQDIRIHDNNAVAGLIGELRPPIAFVIPYQCAHSGEIGIVTATTPTTEAEVYPLVWQALETTEETYGATVAHFADVTRNTYVRVASDEHPLSWLETVEAKLKNIVKGRWDDIRGQYDGFTQVVVRARDQRGHPVPSVAVYMNSFAGETPQILMDNLIEDKHENGHTPGITTFFLRVAKFNVQEKALVSELPKVGGIDLEIFGTDSNTDQIQYVPVRFHVSSDQLQQWLQPHRTTVIDVTLLRIPGPKAFVIS